MGKDQSKANIIIIDLSRIKAITNIISPEIAGSKKRLCNIQAKWKDLIQIYAGANKNVLIVQNFARAKQSERN